jgi:TonB family protein
LLATPPQDEVEHVEFRHMSRRFQVDPFDLLGQKELYPWPVLLPGAMEPNLSIAWNSFHQNFFSELGAFLKFTRVPNGPFDKSFFRDCWVKRGIPARAILAAALWEAVFFVVPWPGLPGAAKRNPAFENTQLTWSGPIDDFPLLNVPKHAAKATREKTAEAQGSPEDDAFHPRQTIHTDPVHPTHPRQTLVRPNAPLDAPKLETALPNMVQLASVAGPERPRLEISEQTLAKLRPRQVKHAATTDTLAADAPNLETRPADMNLSALATPVERPKLEMTAGAAPKVAERASKGETVAAPELATAAAGAPETIIALSAAPGPPTPVAEVPKGNLAARVAMSPEGKGAGTNGGSGGSGTAAANEASAGGAVLHSAVGISITGGNPKPNAGVGGSGGSAGKLVLPKTQSIYKRPDATSSADDPPERTGPPDFSTLTPGAKPEQIFGAHRVYSMNVNMPNVNSATGSWIIHFAELNLPGALRVGGELNAPVPVRKIDPKYPQTAIAEHIQGEVILYGVIQPDGTVDGIELVKGVDHELDSNAIAAFSQWKFAPASKAGQPVALEAIVHIPFHEPERE